jgi:hypothetical protein
LPSLSELKARYSRGGAVGTGTGCGEPVGAGWTAAAALGGASSLPRDGGGASLWLSAGAVPAGSPLVGVALASGEAVEVGKTPALRVAR